MACATNREEVVVKQGFSKLLILRWGRGRFAPFFALGAPESNGRSPGSELNFRFTGCFVKVSVNALFVERCVQGDVRWR